MQFIFAGKQLFTTRAGAADIDRRIDAFLGNLAVQVELHVTGALELFVDNLVHFRAGVDQCGGDNRQAATFLDITGRTEKALGALQCVGVDTTGQYLAGAGDDSVVGAGQTSDRVEQNHHVALVFDQSLGFLDNHLRNLHVTRGRFVKG